MSNERKDWKGGAGACQLDTALAVGATLISVDGDISGWPTGASGRPFVITIDRLGANEKVLCDALSGSSPAAITARTRGWDGTIAVSHSAGVSVEHTVDADTIDDYGGHVYDTTRDDHTQYFPLSGGRLPGAINGMTDIVLAVGTALAEGVANTLARSDHVHVIGTGAINKAAMFLNGVITNQALGDNIVNSAKLAPDCVNRSKIQDGEVTTTELADASVTLAKLGPDTGIPAPALVQPRGVHASGAAGQPAVNAVMPLGTLVAGAAPWLAANTITIPVGAGGLYLIQLDCRWRSDGIVGMRFDVSNAAGVALNPDMTIAVSHNPSTWDPCHAQGSWLRQCPDGDTLQVRNRGNQQTLPNYAMVSRFSVIRIGDALAST